MICLLSIVVFIYSRTHSEQWDIGGSEYYVLGLFGMLGMMVMVSADHLLVIYLGLELMSLCLYAMVAFQWDSPKRSIYGARSVKSLPVDQVFTPSYLLSQTPRTYLFY